MKRLVLFIVALVFILSMVPPDISTQCKEKGGTFSYRAFCPDRTSVTSDDTLYCSQTNSSPGELGCHMEPLERFKEFVGVGHIKPILAEPLGVGLLAFCLFVFGLVVMPLNNAFSRWCEWKADHTAISCHLLHKHG